MERGAAENMNVRILAHGCGMISGIENTIEGMRRVIEQGAHGIECDVQLTKDGEPVLHHDRTTERMTGRRRRVSQTNYKDLRELRVLGRYPIPHLNEALEFLSDWKEGSLFMDFHNSSLALAEAVAKATARYALEERAYPLTVYDERRFLLHTKDVNPKMRLALMPEYPWAILKRAREVQANQVCVGWDRIWYNRYLFKAASTLVNLSSIIKEARQQGFVISAGVANRPEDIRWAAAQGVQGIWTDDAALCRKILEG